MLTFMCVTRSRRECCILSWPFSFFRVGGVEFIFDFARAGTYSNENVE
jgi:hypothetical protein